MKKSLKSFLPPLMILAAGICWGLIGIFTRALGEAGFSSMQLVLMRSAAAAVILSLLLTITDRSAWRIAPRDLWLFVGTGVCSISVFNFCYFTAIEYTSLSTAAILLYIAPTVVTLLSRPIFKVPITRKKALAVAMSFAGCALVAGVGGINVNLIGILAGLGSGVGYALYSIFGTLALRKYKPLTVTTYTFIVSSVAMAPFCDIPGIVGKVSAEPGNLVNIFLLALVCTAVPYILYTFGLRNTEAGKAAVIASIEPVTATVAGIVVFHESVTLWSAVGILLVLGAIAILSLGGTKHEGDV